MLYDPNIATFLQDTLPWAGAFFSILSEMGGLVLIVSLLLTGYWTYRKRETMIITLILVVSVIANYWLKYAFASPRPATTYWYGEVEATNYGLPSGHAQNSSTLYTWLAGKVKTWWMVLVSTILIVMIGVSRVYLGVHFLGDVLVGWAIGIAIGLGAFYFEKQISDFASRIKSVYWYLLFFIIGLILVVVSSILPYPPGDNFGAYGGLTMGAAIAFPLENRYVKFELGQIRTPRLIARGIVGLLLVLGVMLGLSQILPTSEIWLRTLRYFAVAFVGIFLWPLIFEKIGL
ncbi:MAG: phosphatase PAP2 family protein [Candidatus Thorarchaeota archaeon]